MPSIAYHQERDSTKHGDVEAAPVDGGGVDAAEVEEGVVVGVHALRHRLRALYVAALGEKHR